ncbi:MAG TPA: Crp/Fnr family transcriptional regulator [Chitinophagaceae bacterium]|nr:Crp/Fnr family transcriptional regulator [Chitinophagaceae bacterium]
MFPKKAPEPAGKPDLWDEPQGNSPIAVFVRSIHPVRQEVVDYINAHSFPLRIQKGRYLVKAGAVARHLFLVRRGLVRAFIREGSREITTWINDEQEIVTSIRSLALHEPSPEYIQALEDCELAAVEYTVLEHLYDHFAEMNIVGRKVLEQYYRDAEERAFICRIPNARRRYQRFLEHNPNLANRVPVKYIASYLGIAVETLSRIRGKKQ